MIKEKRYLNIVRVEPILEPIDEGYNYTGDYQEFIAPASSYYTLEVWGASGGGNYQYSDGSNAGAAGAIVLDTSVSVKSKIVSPVTI